MDTSGNAPMGMGGGAPITSMSDGGGQQAAQMQMQPQPQRSGSSQQMQSQGPSSMQMGSTSYPQSSPQPSHPLQVAGQGQGQGQQGYPNQSRPPSTGSSQPGTSTASQNQQHIHDAWVKWLEEVGPHNTLQVQTRALEQLVSVSGRDIKYANYLLSKLKVLDRIVPLIVTHATPGQGDSGLLERCLGIVASCSYLSWEDRTKQSLLVNYPQLIDKLVLVLLKGDAPQVQAQAARALWNLFYKNEELKNSQTARALISRLLENLSCKHTRLKLFSIGLLWAMCDNNKVTCAEVGEKDGAVNLLQGLHMSNGSGNAPQNDTSETYFLLISLLSTLINIDTTLRCKKDALRGRISVILQPLLMRTTSTTLMDKICEVLASTLYMQSGEQQHFMQCGGVYALVQAITNPLLRKCTQKMCLALIASVYRSPAWMSAASTSLLPPEQQQKVELIETRIEPAFRHICKLLLEQEGINPCTLECLSMALCLSCLAQGKPRFQKLLVETHVLRSIVMLLTPPSAYSEHDRIKIVTIGLGVVQQVAQQSHEIQKYLCYQSPPSPPPHSVQLSPLYNLKVESPHPYGLYFKSLLECMKVEKLRLHAVKAIMAVVEHQRPLCTLLVNDHESFRTNLIGAIKFAAPLSTPAAKATTDHRSLLHLASCFHVICGGCAQPLDNEAFSANFTKVTQIIVDDKHLTQAFMSAHNYCQQTQKQQQQQQQALLAQQQQQSLQSGVNSAMQSMKSVPPAMPPASMNTAGYNAPQTGAPQQQSQPHSQQQPYYTNTGSVAPAPHNTMSMQHPSSQSVQSSQQQQSRIYGQSQPGHSPTSNVSNTGTGGYSHQTAPISLQAPTSTSHSNNSYSQQQHQPSPPPPQQQHTQHSYPPQQSPPAVNSNIYANALLAQPFAAAQLLQAYMAQQKK